jgi:hypothetical protein
MGQWGNGAVRFRVGSGWIKNGREGFEVEELLFHSVELVVLPTNDFADI